MNFKSLFVPLLAVAALILGGCASDQSDLTANKPAAATHPESIAIKVTGGSDSTTDSASQVQKGYFFTQLTKSLQHARLFGKIVPTGSAEATFQLEVAITPLEPPSIGEQMTATVETNWTLTRVSNGYVLWQKKISASHTTEAKEAFTGIERVRLAIEGAVDANIKNGVSQLGSAPLL